MEHRAIEIPEQVFVKLVRIGLVVLFGLLPFSTLAGHGEEDEREEREEKRTHYSSAFPHSRWTMRFYGLELESEPDGGGLDLLDEDAFGVGGNMEFRFNRRWGIEADLLAAGTDENDCRRCRDDEFHGRHGDDSRGYAGLLVGMNFHLTPSSLIDFHFGPTLGFMAYEEANHHHFFEENYDYDDDVEGNAVLGLNLGIDIPFGRERRWLFYASLKSMRTVGDEDNYYHRDDDHERHDRDWDVAAIGFGYKF